jgi:hypothetical protein
MFVFGGKRGDYLKILHWDQSGLCLVAKRLAKDRFAWPPIADARLRLTPAQLAPLIEDMDRRRTKPPTSIPRPQGRACRDPLGQCRGFLHADADAGFNSLHAPGRLGPGPRLTEVACWAHVRRKIYDVYVETDSPAAREALERMAELLAIEAEIRGRDPAHRLAVRQAGGVAKRLDLKAFLDETLAQINRKAAFAGAIRYATALWPALTRYTTDGRLEMTNNGPERAIRLLDFGRKNYLFAGSDGGGRRAATLYTLIQTARMNGVEREAWPA